MLILVLCRPAEDADQDEFRRLVAAETAALRELKDDGALSGAWNPGHPGAVLMLDVPGEAEAARLTARLPLIQAGLITTEIIPLHPIDLLPSLLPCGGVVRYTTGLGQRRNYPHPHSPGAPGRAEADNPSGPGNPYSQSSGILNPAYRNAIIICATQIGIAQPLFVSTAGRE